MLGCMNRQVIKFSGYLFCFGMCLVTYLVFFYAYIHGYGTLVKINDYGEAQIEMVMLIVLMPIIVGGLIYTLQDREVGMVKCFNCNRMLKEEDAYFITLDNETEAVCSEICLYQRCKDIIDNSYNTMMDGIEILRELDEA